MPIPAGAVAWEQALDPADRADYLVQLAGLMTGGEIIANATVTLLPEAAALGLTIIQDAQHGPWIANDTNIEIWFEVDPAMRGNAAFNAGVDLPLEITITTNATLFRRFQRTMVLRVVNL